jgi:phosphate-selective porin
MKILPSRVLAATFISLMLAGSASAQTTAPTAPAAPATKMAPAKPHSEKAASSKEKTERTAASLECSTQADAKGLHGKERKKFRSDCKKGTSKPN